MKWYAALIVLISMTWGYAELTVPQNVYATAIGQDSFTLRWNPVPDAEEYEVDLKRAISVDFLEDFDSNSTYPIGWSGSNVAIVSNHPELAPQSGSFMSLKCSESELITPILYNPQALEFWAYRSATNDPILTLSIQYATTLDNPTWITIDELQDTNTIEEITTTKTKYSYSPALVGDYYLRFHYTTQKPTNVFLDGIAISCLDPQPIAEFTSPELTYPGTKLSNLDPDTSYLCRVRAINSSQTSIYSEWQMLTTLAASSNTFGGSIINSDSVVFSLPVVDGIPAHTLQLSPATPGDMDYLVSLEGIAGGITYSLECANDLFLNGDYELTHPGYTVTNVEIPMGKVSLNSLAEGFTSFSIDDYESKGVFTFSLFFDHTLPVEMGNMTITNLGSHSLNFQWISHSEIDLLGYRVWRSSRDAIQEAMLVSNLIPATNTSTTTQYVFHDNDAVQEAWYWLEAIDYSGSSRYYGPVYAQLPNPGGSTPAVLQNAFTNIYPNPFNPSTTISYSLAENCSASIRIYDLRGRLIHEHCEALQAAGNHSYVWNAGLSPSGVYLLKLQIGGESFMRKLVLLN